MSNSPLVKVKVISPNKTVPRNHKIDTITIHCMAGQMSAKACGNMFAQKSRQVSSNYGIGPDGVIGLYVDEKDRSWCSSNRANDHRAITIEVASDSKPPYAVTDKAYAALLDLVTDICKRNGISKLVWSTSKNTRVNHKNGANMTVHRDYAAKSCPGDYLYGKMGEIAKTVNSRLGAPASAPAPSGNPYEEPVDYYIQRGSTGNGVKWVQWELTRIKYSVGSSGIDGIFGKDTYAAVLKFQKKWFSSSKEWDGIVGKKTRAALKSA